MPYTNGQPTLHERQPWRAAPRDSAEYAAGWSAHYGRPYPGAEALRVEHQRRAAEVLPLFFAHGTPDHNGNLRLP